MLTSGMLLQVDGIVLQSESDTEHLAKVLQMTLQFGCSIGLRGELGAGKTTLVRCLVGALGGNPAQVSSPSFTLQNEYLVPAGRKIEHWDLYRLSAAPDELYEPPEATTLRIVEWPDRAPTVLDDLCLIAEISVGEDGGRYVHFQGPDSVLVMKEVLRIFGRGGECE